MDIQQLAVMEITKQNNFHGQKVDHLSSHLWLQLLQWPQFYTRIIATESFMTMITQVAILAECPSPDTSHREISADLPGQESQGKKGKWRRIEKICDLLTIWKYDGSHILSINQVWFKLDFNFSNEAIFPFSVILQLDLRWPLTLIYDLRPHHQQMRVPMLHLWPNFGWNPLKHVEVRAKC